MVLGHEPAGTVMKTGTGVTGWSAGDRAAFEPGIYCYHCEFCRSGRHNICENIRFLSNPGIPGFFRDLVNLPAGNLQAIPPNLSFAEATLIEPLAVALHSMKFAAAAPDEGVVVFGAGAIGLLTIASLRAAGVKRIWAVDPVAHRRELALQIGAHAAFDPAERESIPKVEVAIDCAAKEDTTNWAFRAAKHGGRVVLTGIHSGALVPFETSHMRRKELTIFNVRRSNHEEHEALTLMTEHPDWFAPIVTHTRPLEAIAEGFRIAEFYEDGVGKLVIQPNSR
jgi:L-iditol 2-dehydrogenase